MTKQAQDSERMNVSDLPPTEMSTWSHDLQKQCYSEIIVKIWSFSPIQAQRFFAKN